MVLFIVKIYHFLNNHFWNINFKCDDKCTLGLLIGNVTDDGNTYIRVVDNSNNELIKTKYDNKKWIYFILTCLMVETLELHLISKELYVIEWIYISIIRGCFYEKKNCYRC